MKFILIAILLLTSTAHANYTMVVPQSVGGGTDVWSRIVAEGLSEKLGEDVVIRNIPGAKDIPGFNKFHNVLQHDDKTIMVAHGGNAEAFLTDTVDYNYHEYRPIGMMNLDIIVGKKEIGNKLKFAASSGSNPDVMAILMLMHNGKTVADFESFAADNLIYVKGMSGGERRLAYLRDELNATRESTAAYYKYTANVEGSSVWFAHGVLDIETGKVVADPNFKEFFPEVYKERWGEYPSGEFYEAYLLVKLYRDVMQKSLWMGKNNPNADKVTAALVEVINDKALVDKIYARTGKYDWIIGEDVFSALDLLQSKTKKDTLQGLVKFINNSFGYATVFKENLCVDK